MFKHIWLESKKKSGTSTQTTHFHIFTFSFLILVMWCNATLHKSTAYQNISSQFWSLGWKTTKYILFFHISLWNWSLGAGAYPSYHGMRGRPHHHAALNTKSLKEMLKLAVAIVFFGGKYMLIVSFTQATHIFHQRHLFSNIGDRLL